MPPLPEVMSRHCCWLANPQVRTESGDVRHQFSAFAPGIVTARQVIANSAVMARAIIDGGFILCPIFVRDGERDTVYAAVDCSALTVVKTQGGRDRYAFARRLRAKGAIN